MSVPLYIKILLWSSYLISLYFAIFWFLVLLDKEQKPKAKKLSKFPKVSIVIPAYNEEKNITTTLKSLVSLNYPKNRLEIIVVNDGSKDNTKNAVSRFIAENRKFDIRLLNKRNEGKGAALNDALKIAKGDFFVCLDADSIVTRDALSKILPHFTDENIAVVLPLLKVEKPKNLWQKMQWLEYIINMFYKKLMSRLNCVHVSPGPFSVYRTGILRKVNGFDEDNLTEDLEITLRLQSKNYRIVQLLDAEVFTLAPKTFRELYKQRNRWYKGSVINAFKYRHMMFNKKYGDFGMIQMPTIIVSGLIAVILVSSAIYYGLKPYFKALYNSFFIDFDFYTLMKTFKFDFSLLDLNYMAILVALIMLSITIFIIRKSHAETNENPKRHGFFSLISYIFFYFLVIGFIWIGIIFDLAFGKKQKW
ncbi:glycosyltransferase family 2 protein [Candidatus Woesearchaeota archaeon]|nr:glycosyltransferase family 2 protein [Candidatus Woesearchaeota archaeon]